MRADSILLLKVFHANPIRMIDVYDDSPKKRRRGNSLVVVIDIILFSFVFQTTYRGRCNALLYVRQVFWIYPKNSHHEKKFTERSRKLNLRYVCVGLLTKWIYSYRYPFIHLTLLPTWCRIANLVRSLCMYFFCFNQQNDKR